MGNKSQLAKSQLDCCYLQYYGYTDITDCVFSYERIGNYYVIIIFLPLSCLTPVPGDAEAALLSPRHLQSPAHLIPMSRLCCSSNLHHPGKACDQGDQRWAPRCQWLYGAVVVMVGARGPPGVGWQVVSGTNCISGHQVWCSACSSLASPI